MYELQKVKQKIIFIVNRIGDMDETQQEKNTRNFKVPQKKNLKTKNNKNIIIIIFTFSFHLYLK